MSNYDAWLEKPYQDRYAQDALYERAAEEIAEAEGREVEDITDDEIEYYLEAQEEAAAEAAAEQARDFAMEMDYEDRY